MKQDALHDLVSHNPKGFPWAARGKARIPWAPSGECRWCGGALSGVRTSWCSSRCFDAGQLRMNWSALRILIVARDRVCMICDGVTACMEVDHIHAVADGGTDDPQNLRLLCDLCHREVTRAQRAAWSGRSSAAAGA